MARLRPRANRTMNCIVTEPPCALDTGDRATGVSVLRELYAKVRASPAPTDLESLWQQLGIRRRGREIVFDSAAPLAHIRAAITARSPAR